jgi:hypothetical protein
LDDVTVIMGGARVIESLARLREHVDLTQYRVVELCVAGDRCAAITSEVLPTNGKRISTSVAALELTRKAGGWRISRFFGVTHAKGGEDYLQNFMRQHGGERIRIGDPNAPADASATPPPPSRVTTKPGEYPITAGLKLVIAQNEGGVLDKHPITDAELVWQKPGEEKPSEIYDIRLSEGLPYAIGWREDGSALWVSCGAKLGSGADERITRYLRIFTVQGPGDVDESMMDFDDVMSGKAGNVLPEEVRRVFETLDAPAPEPKASATSKVEDAEEKKMLEDDLAGLEWGE